MAGTQGPLLPLSRFWRTVLATLLSGLAVIHVLWPSLAIDTLSVGLIAVAAIIVFFDVESFEFQGIRARRLQKDLKAAEESLPEIEVSAEPPPLPVPPPPQEHAIAIGYEGLVHREPLELLPPQDPTERLLWVAEQIRIELIVLCGNAGHLPSRVTWDQYSSLGLSKLLVERGVIPPQFTEPISTVVEVRNTLVEPTKRLPPHLIASASSIGLDLLLKLRTVKRQYNRIRQAHVHLFRDQSLSTRHPGAGVMIIQLDDHGTPLSTSVFPRRQIYVEGRFVSWEWHHDLGFDQEAWYLDPATNTSKLAFSEALIFGGREYPTQWGLEYRLREPHAGLA
jgi:hypothetical protein